MTPCRCTSREHPHHQECACWKTASESDRCCAACRQLLETAPRETLVDRLKAFVWYLGDEWAELRMLVLSSLPLQVGIAARKRLLPGLLGGMGENTAIQSGVHISTPEKFVIGSNCHIARRVFITAGGGVRIGNWVGVGPDAKIWSVNHRYTDPDVPWIAQGWTYKEVVIDDDVWIGASAFIMPGVHIGHGALISAHTVVMKSVPAYAVMAGNPGRLIGWRKTPARDDGRESEVGRDVLVSIGR